MGFRWRKALRIFPGFQLNLSHRSVRGQIGGSPLSFSFRLFGASPARRITASLPGTGLSYVKTSYPSSEVAVEAAAPPVRVHSLLRQALNQVGLSRSAPVPFDELHEQPSAVRREIVKAAVPRFNQLLVEHGVRRDRLPSAPEAIDNLSDERIAALVNRLREV